MFTAIDGGVTSAICNVLSMASASFPGGAAPCGWQCLISSLTRSPPICGSFGGDDLLGADLDEARAKVGRPKLIKLRAADSVSVAKFADSVRRAPGISHAAGNVGRRMF